MAASNPFILIVDDNPNNLQVLGSILEGKGYEVALAQNGLLALDFIKKEKPDLILLDIMMPEINGYEICKKLKEDNETKDVPVIFLTAKTETEDIVRGFDVGAVDYILKPFNSAELLARIRTHIKLRQAQKEIQLLRGIIPICAYCKKIRNDTGFWEQVEDYIHKHTMLEFSHGLCPDCYKRLSDEKEWLQEDGDAES